MPFKKIVKLILDSSRVNTLMVSINGKVFKHYLQPLQNWDLNTANNKRPFFILMNGLSRRDEKMYYRHKFDPLLGELLHLTANMKHDTVFQNEDNLWDRTLYNNY